MIVLRTVKAEQHAHAIRSRAVTRKPSKPHVQGALPLCERFTHHKPLTCTRIA